MKNREAYTICRHLSAIEYNIENLKNRLDEIYLYSITKNKDDSDKEISEVLKDVLKDYEAFNEKLSDLKNKVKKAEKQIVDNHYKPLMQTFKVQD